VTQEKVSDDIILDFNEMGQLLGIEFLDAETTMPPDSRLTGITPNNFRDMIKYIRSED
jgi:uncharacterized protein YuzE